MQLNNEQLQDLNRFEEAIKNGESYICTRDRGFGKTTVLNELGFIYQALGYNVLVLSRRPLEYYATNWIDNDRDLLGFDRNKTIMLVDDLLTLEKECKQMIKWVYAFSRMGFSIVGYGEK